MNICMYCLHDEGKHTIHCDKLKEKARNSNTTYAITYSCLRATISGYKQLIGEKDKYLIPMWEQSEKFWGDSIGNMIERAAKEGRIKEVYMPEA